MSEHLRPGAAPLWWPPEWRRRVLGDFVGFIYGLAVVGLFGWLAATLLGLGWTIPGLVCLLFAVIAIPIVIEALPVRRHDAPIVAAEFESTQGTERGIRFDVRPPPMWTSAALTFFAFCGVAGGILMAVGGVRLLELMGTHEANASDTLILVVSCICIILPNAIVLITGINGLRHRRHGLGVYLSADNIVVDLGWHRTSLSWQDISEIRAVRRRPGWRTLRAGPLRRYPNWIVIASPLAETVPRRELARAWPAMWLPFSAPDEVIAIPDDRLRADPLVTYHVLWYFLEHPEDRDAITAGDLPRIQRLVSA